MKSKDINDRTIYCRYAFFFVFSCVCKSGCELGEVIASIFTGHTASSFTSNQKQSKITNNIVEDLFTGIVFASSAIVTTKTNQEKFFKISIVNMRQIDNEESLMCISFVIVLHLFTNYYFLS